MNEGFKKAFTFTKGERRAIIIILSILLITLIINYLIVKTPPKKDKSHHNIDSILALHNEALEQMKSIKLAEELKRKDYQEQRKKQKEDYKRRTEKRKKSQARMDSLIKNDSNKREKPSRPAKIKIIELNSCDSASLLNIPNIGPSYAHRIIEYKSKLGGYCNKKQLYEVYGMDSIRYQSIKDYLSIDTANIKKININYDDFKNLIRHPYLEYEDVKKIVYYREHQGMINGWNDLCKILNRQPNSDLIYYISYK